MTSVFVVAASPIVRSGLEALIAGDERFKVVGTSSEITALVGAIEGRAIEEQPIDVVLWEVERQTASRFTSPLAIEETAGEVRSASAVIALVDDPTEHWIAEALRAGVRAVLPRVATAGEIIAAVEAAASGLIVVHPDWLDPLLSSAPPSLSPPDEETLPGSEIDALTPREVEVLAMLAEGLGNKIIAWRLGISEHTIKFHVSSIFAKLGASSRTEAVTLGIRRGLIML